MELSENDNGSCSVVENEQTGSDGVGVQAPAGWTPPASLPGWATKDTARFWAKVRDTGSCMIWVGATATNSYGTFFFAGRGYRAHRIAIGLGAAHGLDVDHLCRVRNCVNPLHLEVVTRSENCFRGAQSALRTTCARGHAVNSENTYQRLKSKGRMCRICRRIDVVLHPLTQGQRDKKSAQQRSVRAAAKAAAEAAWRAQQEGKDEQ